MSAEGRASQWTGAHCVPDAGSAARDDWIAQANLVESPRVWEAMGEAFTSSAGSLAERLLAALDAAQAEGGDWRGQGGAAIIVVPAVGDRWERIIDLRVEEEDKPLVELRRLLDRPPRLPRGEPCHERQRGHRQKAWPPGDLRPAACALRRRRSGP